MGGRVGCKKSIGAKQKLPLKKIQTQFSIQKQPDRGFTIRLCQGNLKPGSFGPWRVWFAYFSIIPNLAISAFSSSGLLI
jgi:hypothetical protein